MSTPLTPEEFWEDRSHMYPEGWILQYDLEVIEKEDFMEYSRQTAALREELNQIMNKCGVRHVNGKGGALVVVSYILKERQELAAWKKEQIATFSPLLDFGQSKESGLPLGVSIVTEAINALKERKTLREELAKMKAERDKALNDFANLQFSMIQAERRKRFNK